ncbi:MAG: hypothetical protein WC003_07865 [Terrimicrobiaceae bacterium]
MKRTARPFRNPAIRHRQSKIHGVALVITLVAVVLLTVLVVAFFTRALLNRQIAFTSTNLVKTDILARSALDIVVGEIRQEIVDGSKTNTISGITIYEPLSATNAVPQKVGVVSPDATIGGYTIVKVSADNTPINPGGAGLGSDVSLDKPSANGRSNSNWFTNGPQLGSQSTLPSWVYLTRGNGVVVNPPVAEAKDRSSANYVIGRFAYTVYDTGGLLDANVAGYPAATPFAAPAADIGAKGSAAYADLTALGLGAAAIDSLVSWRNKATGTTAESFKEWATGQPRASGTPNALSLAAARSGHIRSAAGDNSFLSRRDFLAFASKNNWPTNVAGYFNTFSRAVNAPSWKPSTPVGSSIDYEADAEKPASANRNLPNVRFANAATITHYKDDGTAEKYSVSAGDPLIRQRFSLAKLAWLTHSGTPPSGITAEMVQADFGLRWNNARKRWDYVGPSGTSAQSAIKTLAQVAAETAPREPNFFELLKAGILSGSLGKHPGVAGDGPYLASVVLGESRNQEGPMGWDFESYSSVPDYQIIQIGANIIDQADADNYPTAIYLDFTSSPPLAHSYPQAQGEMFKTAFGTENLPYLACMGMLTAVIQDGAAPGDMQTVGSWLQPEVWNPHQQPGGYPDATTPAQLRLVTLGESYALNFYSPRLPANPKNPGDSVVFGEDPNAPSDQGRIDFVNSANFFAQPVPLTSSNATSPTSRNHWPTTDSGSLIDFSAANPFIAVWTGDVERVKPPAPAANAIRIVPELISPLTFILQYFDGDGWRPYSLIARIHTIGTQHWASGNTNGNASWKDFMAHADPRTDRFSTSEGIAQGQSPPNGWPIRNTIQWGSGTTGYGPIYFGWPRPGADFTFLGPTGQPPVATASVNILYPNLWARNQGDATNLNGTKAYYSDPDGVIRPGDAFRANFTSGEGIMTYHGGVTHARRPVILNRPFRSAGELGYVFRDLPFKTLDLWSDQSADSALLDLFSPRDQPPVITGRMNPNSASPLVLSAIFTSTTKNEAGGAVLGASDAQSLATQIAAGTGSDPLRNPAQLSAATSAAIESNLASGNVIADLPNKAVGEAPVRSLSAVADTRTWNLLVDVVAQSGRVVPNASGLDQFVVEGERRYWLHAAIDRYTGRVIDQQLEPSHE